MTIIIIIIMIKYNILILWGVENVYKVFYDIIYYGIISIDDLGIKI
jgi:hypothetical protein